MKQVDVTGHGAALNMGSPTQQLNIQAPFGPIEIGISTSTPHPPKKKKILFYYYNVYVLYNLKAVICQATIKYGFSSSKKL